MKKRTTTEVTKLERQCAKRNKPGTGKTFTGRSTGKGSQVIVKLEVRDQAALVQLAEGFGEAAADLWLAGKLDLDHPDE